MQEAELAEVFGSIQGEGPLVGVNQLFIRFAGCNLRCKYCDTGYALDTTSEFRWKVERPAKAGIPKWEVVKNPVSAHQLIEIIERFDAHRHSISLTGGEPLQQANFIKEFLALLPTPFSLLPVYLETNATLPQELRKIIDHLNIIAMDIKLPSSTNLRGFWKEHKESLAIAKECEVFVKAVITHNTTLEDVQRLISLIEETDPKMLLILQPDTDNPPPKEILFSYQSRASLSLNEVRIIPQIHRLMGWE